MQIDIDLEEPIALALARQAAQQRSEKEQGPLQDAKHRFKNHLSLMSDQCTPLSTGDSDFRALGPDEVSAAQLNLALDGGSSKAPAMQTGLSVSRLALEHVGHVMSMNVKQALLQCQASEHITYPLHLVLFSMTQQLLPDLWHQSYEEDMLLSSHTTQVL